MKPETVIVWHRRGFAQFWAWKSKRRGRPSTAPEIVALIVRMANDNPRWSRRRIANELAMLGYRVDKNTVARCMPKPADRPRPPRSQTWGTFVRNQLVGTIAIDFFTVPTVRFEVLYVFVVLSLERRRILHVNVTAHPNAEWTGQQIVEAVGCDDTFTMLIRDRDGIYGAAFDRRSRRCKTSTALNPVRAASGSDVASFRSPIMEAMRIWCTKQAAFGLAESMSRPCKPSATDARWVQLLRRPHVRGLSHG